jgi:hypothetical protein
VKISMDPWIGCGDNYRFYEPLKMHLHNRGITTLAKPSVVMIHGAGL